MPVALMSLGQNAFYVPMLEVESPGFETLTRDTSFTWVPQGRLNSPLALQYTGQGQDSITIEGRLFPGFFGGAQTLDALRYAGSEGKPLTLIRYFPVHDENGKQIQGVQAQILGKFVIMRIRRGEKNINSAGAPNQIDFALELQAYSDDVATVVTPVSATTQGTTASQAAATATLSAATGTTSTPQ